MSTLDLESLLGIPGFKKYLQQINAAIEASLEDADPIIRDAALRHALAPSKRLRPALLIAVVQAMGKPINKKVITGCAAIELAHISSLIHDDIIDSADSRHGIPTINSQEGVDQAIIVGDYVLAKACGVAAQVSAGAAQIIATAIARICNGQSREVADQYNLDRDGESMLRSIRGKTAELFAAACRIGGLCAGLPAGQCDALAAYGEQFGMAFQLIDDVLDLTSTDELLGKAVGNDIIEGVYTMPVLLALHGPRQEEVREALVSRKRPTSAFTTLLIEEYAISQTVKVAEQYTMQASSELRKLGKKELDSLRNLPATYTTWVLQHLISTEFQSAVPIHLQNS